MGYMQFPLTPAWAGARRKGTFAGPQTAMC